MAKMTKPTPAEIRQTRTDAGLTQQAGADLVYKTPRAWQHYEQGTRTMPRSVWELFKHKIGGMN